LLSSSAGSSIRDGRLKITRHIVRTTIR